VLFILIGLAVYGLVALELLELVDLALRLLLGRLMVD